MSAGGHWVTFEGIEGTGKTTQLRRLATALRSLGLDPVVTREPGGTALGTELRSLLLRPSDPPMHALTELLLYAADRAQHLAEVILPALESGRPVLCDRYVDATVAYQGHARGLGVERVRELHRHVPLDRLPDRTLVLDLDVARALSRARRRDEHSGKAEAAGRFEAEALEFHERVRRAYRRIAEESPRRVRLVDAEGDADSVQRRVRRAVGDLWPGLEAAP